ncbi:MAG: hypothetical protein K0Q49_693 [Haloplasmataceae bacterium]|jgi:predicted transcriptional regulator|nr:hypothetical protein [Haloplasmataceae bacterium]
MSRDLREIIKKVGITQQELADYLGITRQYLNNYLDECLEEPKLPQKYIENIMFLFEVKTRDELFDENFNRTAKVIKRRISVIKSTKESIDNLFNIEHEKKIELFKIVENFQYLASLDKDLLESFAILLENIVKEPNYQALISYVGKKYLIIDFNDERFNNDAIKSREALLHNILDKKEFNFNDYKDLYEEFINSTKKQDNIDIEALKQSLSDLGYNNLSQKDVVDLLKKYNQLKNTEKE